MAIADEIEASADQIEKLERAIVLEAEHDEDMRRLNSPWIPRHTAATINALVPDRGGFRSAPHFAAWLGLTTRSHSSGQRTAGTNIEDANSGTSLSPRPMFAIYAGQAG